MTDHLTTPLVHKFMVSPAGIVFNTRLFERVKTRSVPGEFRVARARAVADVTADDGVDAFVRRLGIDADEGLRERVEDALTAHRHHRREYEAVNDEWNAVFWGGEGVPMDERVELEGERREVSETWATPTSTFRFLTRRAAFSPVEYAIPSPEDAIATWHDELESPERVYAAPARQPTVESSDTMLGPETTEYLVRFPSPSPYTDDRAYARVYEPAEHDESADHDGPLPTLIYGSGLGMMYDQLSYWPEEEYVGRSLAPSGFRVVLLESPWHGRRETPGQYSGEPYLRSMPVTLFQLYAAQAREIAVLTDWAREQGSPTVGIGGVSLGGIVTLFVAGHSDQWPERYRPDAAFPVAMSANIDELVLGSSIVELLDGNDALRDAGWDAGTLHELAPLLRPPETPGIAPENVYPFGGLRDEMTDYESASELFDRWGVPAGNRTVWDCGHFGTLLRVIRKDDYQKRVASVLSDGGF